MKKNIMKKVFLISMFLMISCCMMAQNDSKKLSFAVGPVAYLPIGDYNTYYNPGFGGEVEAAYKFSDKIEGFVQSGYSTFTGKTISGTYLGIPYSFDAPKLGYIPVLGGVRYTTGNFTFGAAAGVGIYSTTDSTGSSFTYSPQIGYTIGNLQIVANMITTSVKTDDPLYKLANVTSISAVGIKLFYKF
jgi:hypothetical protein